MSMYYYSKSCYCELCLLEFWFPIKYNEVIKNNPRYIVTKHLGYLRPYQYK